jgi:iron-sulfur cluster assembly protein
MSSPIITITDAAAERIKEILSKAQESNVAGVRVSVVTGGCAGMTYEMHYLKEKKVGDEVIKDKGVEVYIDPKAIMYLLGTTMDYKKEKFSSSFVFNNPNETERCGCGESFKI